MADTTSENSDAKYVAKNSGRPSGRGGSTPGAQHAAEQAAIKNPDSLQQGIINFWGFVEDHAKWIAAALVLLLIAGIAHVITHNYWDRQERKAQAAYFPLEEKYSKLKDGFERAKFKALAPPAAKADDKDDKKEVPATGDFQKDYGAAIPDIEKFAREYSGTTAGAQAALTAAGVYLEYKQPEKAIELAEIPVKHLGSDHVISQLSRLLLGSAQQAKGDCGAAVKTWQNLMDNKNANFLHGEAGLRSGLCFESMNQPDKAMELYRKVAGEGAQTSAGTTAKGLLRALEIKNGKTSAIQPKAN